MSGWIVMVALAAAVLAGLWRWIRRDAGGLQFLGAALLLALAGYAWQGRPGLAGAPKAAQAQSPRPKSEFAMLRGDLLGAPDASSSTLSAAEPYLALGQTEQAVDLLRDAVAQSPRDYRLWLGLADALFQHAEEHVTPAAQLAYQRAEALAPPDSPAPTFFYAINLAHEGANQGNVAQLDAADQIFAQIGGTAVDARWREVISTVRGNIARARSGMGAGGQPAQ